MTCLYSIQNRRKKFCPQFVIISNALGISHQYSSFTIKNALKTNMINFINWKHVVRTSYDHQRQPSNALKGEKKNKRPFKTKYKENIPLIEIGVTKWI